MRKQSQEFPPAIVIGGGANSISVARSLGAHGIKVYALCGSNDHIRYSRFSEWIPFRNQTTESWLEYLTGPESEFLRGSVLLAACDASVEMIAKNRITLSTRFRLDISNTEAQLCMLDKLSTYNQAVRGAVSTPQFWPVSSLIDLFRIRKDLVFPLLVKPLKSHEFRGPFPTQKYFLANNFNHLLTVYEKASNAGIGVMLVEEIPGPDDRLCSYYTYLDENGDPVFDFTKRVIRRYPVNMGLATYHVTDLNPEAKHQAMKLFKTVGLRGLANAEFKRDDRDGQLKLIECNARFTAANGLLAASGFDLALFVYYRLVGKPYHLPEKYEVNKRLWSPVRDFYAFRELRRRRELTFFHWLRSILHKQSFPYFKWHDPMPTIMIGSKEIGQPVARRFYRARLSLGRKLNWRAEEQ